MPRAEIFINQNSLTLVRRKLLEGKNLAFLQLTKPPNLWRYGRRNRI